MIELRRSGVKPPQPAAERTAGGPLDRQSVVVTGGVTGALAWRDRNEGNELIRSAGGSSSGSVSKRTTLLVAGGSTGSKLTMAQEIGVRVIAEQEFAELFVGFLS